MLATIILPFFSPCHAGPLLSKHSPFCFHVGVCMFENLGAAFLNPKYLNIYINFGSSHESDPSVFVSVFPLTFSLLSYSMPPRIALLLPLPK